MKTKPKLKLEYNPNLDWVKIEGVKYSGDLFRKWGEEGFPVGTHMRISKRENGVLSVEQIDSTRIKLGPFELACKACGAKDTFVLDIENPNNSPKPENGK